MALCHWCWTDRVYTAKFCSFGLDQICRCALGMHCVGRSGRSAENHGSLHVTITCLQIGYSYNPASEAARAASLEASQVTHV